MYTDNRVARLDMRKLSSASQAVGMYHQGGRISNETGFGEDLLVGDIKKASIRTQAFCERYPSYDAIFHEFVSLSLVKVINIQLQAVIMILKCRRHEKNFFLTENEANA